MKKWECSQVEYAISDLEALRDFNPPEEVHKPKLDRVIDRLYKLLSKVSK